MAPRELSEAREQQHAASEVLQIIGSFGAELDPVFEAILCNARRICEARYGNLNLLNNGAFQIVASQDAERRCGFGAFPRRDLAATPPALHRFFIAYPRRLRPS
jgi:hypothetical protein